MDHDELVKQVERSLRRIAGKDLEGTATADMDARVAAFVREEVRKLDRDQILSRFDTPGRSLEAFWGYLDQATDADLEECCRCMEEEPECAV